MGWQATTLTGDALDASAPIVPPTVGQTATPSREPLRLYIVRGALPAALQQEDRAMRSDDRIRHYAQATEEMIEGRFRVDIPTGEDDIVGDLGKNLEELRDYLNPRLRS